MPGPRAAVGWSCPASSRFPRTVVWLATYSHSASVGSRQPFQRANASASKQLMWHTGVSTRAESPCQPLSVNTRQPVLSPVSRRQYRGACQAPRFTLSQPSESQSSGRVYASSDMNSRYSRQVTLRFAIWNGSKKNVVAGSFVIKAKIERILCPKWITSLH